MIHLADVQRQVQELSEEDRKGLVAYLLCGMSDLPSGPDDVRVEKREAEMDSGAVVPISHEEFLAQVGRIRR